MAAVGDRLQAVASLLDLDKAIEGLDSNDLLPPRVEDKVAGQLRAGFLASLRASLEDGSYRPSPADRVLVPKQRFASRVASLVGLQDRVVYAALVDSCGSKIERTLDDLERVFWPRGIPTPGKWKEFETAPLAEASTTHVVFADVAGFYESVDHARLRRVLIASVGHTPTADAIVDWLGEVMQNSRGLPQGYAASDHLATLYLAESDAAVARAGFTLFRHGDDMRVPVDSYPEALRAAHSVEQALRACDLLPNSSKLAIETVGKYRGDLSRTDEDAQELRRQLQLDAAQKLLEADEEDAYALLGRVGVDLDEPGGYGRGWAMGAVDVAELAELISPPTSEHAWAMFADAMARRPGGGGALSALSNEHFHERIAGALPVLAGAKDGRALEHCGILLSRHSDETLLVATYLSALSGSASTEVQAICASELAAETFSFGWQRAWLWAVLRYTDIGQLPDGVATAARQVISADAHDWVERVEAAKLLGSIGKLPRSTLVTLWERAPLVYGADLIAAVTMMAKSELWAERFLSTAKQDPVHVVVRRNVSSGQRLRG